MMDRDILEYIKHSANMDFTDVLKSDERLDVARYLSPLANCFLGWYPFKKECRIILIGSCFGSFAEQLTFHCDYLEIYEPDEIRYEATKIRLREYIDKGQVVILNQLAEYMGTFCVGGRYDYVIVAMDSNDVHFHNEQNCDIYEKMIALANFHLREDGKLLFAVPNSLGTAYLSGKKKPKSAINKKELSNLMCKHFPKFKFYYPYPDHLMPQMIYSDEYPPDDTSSDLSNRLSFYENFQGSMICNQKDLLQELTINNIAEYFANSFIVEVARDKKYLSNVAYSILSPERARERSFATNICTDNYVRKTAIYPEGITGLKILQNNLEEMERNGLDVLPVKIEGNCGKMFYMKVRTLSDYFKSISEKEPSEETRDLIFTLVDKLYQDILKSSEHASEEYNVLKKFAPDLDWGPILKKCYLEMIPVNTFAIHLDDGMLFEYYDQEFVYENCPAKFPLTRAIYDIYALSPLIEQHVSKVEMLERYGLTELWEPTRRAEDEFQIWLRNRDVYTAKGKWSNASQAIINNNRKELERAGKIALTDSERNEYNLFNPINGLGSRKIIIFGSGKQYQYYMEMLGELYPPAYVVDNNPEKWDNDCISPIKLKKLALENYRIVIAVGAYEEIAKQLTEMEITEYKVFNKHIYERLQNVISNKVTDCGKDMVILFGTGKFAMHYMKLMGKVVKPIFAMDNNQKRWGSEFAGVQVESPDKIINLLHKGVSVRIVVAVAKYHDIVEQLRAMGVDDDSIVVYNKEESFTCGDARDTIVNGKYGVGYLPGAFDMFHIGHLNMLKNAKEHCRHLIVGVISDEICRKEKHKEPIISYDHRAEIVRQCKYVDEVVCIDDSITDKFEALKKLNFDVMFSGSDHDYSYHRKMFRSFGADFMQFPYTDGISSSKLREMLNPSVT